MAKIHGSRDVQDGTIEGVDIKDGSITNADIASDAAIDQSKISQSSGWITNLINSENNFLKNNLSSSSLSNITNSACNSVTWDVTENITANGSLKIICGASGTGRKVSISMNDLSDAQITELIKLSFFYRMTVGGDDSVTVYVLNGSDKYYLSPQYLVSASGTLTKYEGLLTLSTQTNNSLVFEFKDNTATTLYIGQALLANRTIPQGAVITEWQDYTLAITATVTNPVPGTVVQNKAKWRRVGSHIEIRISYETSTGGSAGSGTYMFSLPPGIQADTSIFPTINAGSGLEILACGIAYLYNSTPNNCITAQVAPYSPVAGQPKDKLIVYSATGFAPYSISTVSSSHFALSAPIRYHISASFPVVGWTSSINLVTEAQEFAFNTQAAINTNDTTSFGYGPNGTLILANTIVAYYDVEFKNNIQDGDIIKLELRSKVNGRWIDIENASVPSLFVRSLSDYQWVISGSNNYSYSYGGWCLYQESNKVRVYFSGEAAVSGTAWSSNTTVTRSWTNVISASDGYDRWRVRKISNGNMAEAPASGIYESGQNANGYYVKYVDGTLMQWKIRLASDTGQASKLFTIVWPVPFIDTNYTMTHSFYENTSGVGQYNTSNGLEKTTTGMLYTMYTTNNFENVAYADFFAIGKWNLSRSVAAPGTPIGESTVFASVAIANSGSVTANNPVPFLSILEDSLNTITLATGRFTAPISGVYLFSANCSQSTAIQTFYFWKNGSISVSFGSTYANWIGTGSAILRLAAGDYVDVRPNNTVTMTGGTFMVARLSA